MKILVVTVSLIMLVSNCFSKNVGFDNDLSTYTIHFPEGAAVYNHDFYAATITPTDYKLDDVIWAIETLLKYADDNYTQEVYAVNWPPAERLRMAADENEQKERDIQKAKEILEKLKGNVQEVE